MTPTPTWFDRATTALIALAASGDPFTSDDLIDVVGVPDADHQPNARNNQVGAVFREAARQGIIRSEGRVVQSRQPHRKGGAVRVWRGIGTP